MFLSPIAIGRKKKLDGSQRNSQSPLAINVNIKHQDTIFVIEYASGLELHIQGKVSQSLLRELIYV